MLSALTELGLTACGSVRVAPALRVTIYLDRSDSPEIVEYTDAALALLRSELTHYQAGNMKEPAVMGDRGTSVIASWFRRPRALQTYWAQFTGAPEQAAHGATLHVFVYFNPPQQLSPEEIEIRRERARVLHEERGYATGPMVSEITLTLPPDRPAARAATIVRWLLARPLITQTPFASGHAGLGLNYDQTVANMEINAQIQGHVGYAVTRYPGLDWHSPVVKEIMRWNRGVRDRVPHIKRVNWLTLLSYRAIDTLGTPAEVIDRLESGPDIVVHRLAHGVMVQAGPAPQLGDSNTGLLSEAYRHVGRILRPLRVPKLSGLGGGFRDELAQRWLEAFDA